MSFIPSVDEKYDDDGDLNPYWDGLLKGEDKARVFGYDEAVEKLTQLLDYLDSFKDEMPDDIDFKAYKDSEKINESDEADIDALDLSDATLSLIAVKDIIKRELGIWRTEIVVSILDGYDDENNPEGGE